MRSPNLRPHLSPCPQCDGEEGKRARILKGRPAPIVRPATQSEQRHEAQGQRGHDPISHATIVRDYSARLRVAEPATPQLTREPNHHANRNKHDDTSEHRGRAELEYYPACADYHTDEDHEHKGQPHERRRRHYILASFHDAPWRGFDAGRAYHGA